ncbi:hypothetical protein BDA96_09G235500 [Sorghum bicolor]|uniref:Uncharacterized protein n=1 Tax=Sorghum bicolor TaxID=4558 RepID=A0A921QBD0_SORBI|nr:hypothetical protein BDA96_09G235500 [Sorghum bicolor]
MDGCSGWRRAVGRFLVLRPAALVGWWRGCVRDRDRDRDRDRVACRATNQIGNEGTRTARSVCMFGVGRGAGSAVWVSFLAAALFPAARRASSGRPTQTQMAYSSTVRSESNGLEDWRHHNHSRSRWARQAQPTRAFEPHSPSGGPYKHQTPEAPHTRPQSRPPQPPEKRKPRGAARRGVCSSSPYPPCSPRRSLAAGFLPSSSSSSSLPNPISEADSFWRGIERRHRTQELHPYIGEHMQLPA